MFGSISEWFYRSLLGINSAAPAFKKIIIKPQPVRELLWAKGSYESMYGTIGSGWKKEGRNFSMEVTIPPNTTAEVWIPAGPDSAIKEGDRNVQDAKDIRYIKTDNGYFVVQVGSGNYKFSSTLKD
jgi:alpha-L-rhamnosidase